MAQKTNTSHRIAQPPLKRIAAIHQGALGDFLLALPVFEELYKAYPTVKIDFWAAPEYAALMNTKPYAGKVHSCRGSELVPFFHDSLWEQAAVPEFFKEAELILIFGQQSSRFLAPRLAGRLDRPVHWIQSFPNAEQIQPVSLFLLEQCRQLGLPLKDTIPHLDPLPEEASAVRDGLVQGDRYDPKPILIHPGSGGMKKVWPLARWWALLQWLCRECRLPVLMTLGPADEALRDFANATSSLGVRSVEGIPLTRLTAMLAASRFYMGSDSGVTHLAATTGIPVVVLFGPTRPEVWAPRGPNVHVIRSDWEEKEVLTWSKHSPSLPVEPSVKEVVESLLERVRPIRTRSAASDGEGVFQDRDPIR